MTFTHLRPLGAGYEHEQGQEGHDRRGALGMLEGRLLALYTQSDQARATARGTQVATNVPSGAGRVRALMAFHTEQQKKSTAEERVNLEIIRFRQWLFRQHARLMPDGHIDWSRSATRVEYDNDVRRQQMTRVTVRGGLLVTADGKPFDTTKMVTMFSGPGNAIYVMSPDGHLHVSSHSVGYRHHSSLLAGASVAGAGEMCVRQGRIVWISNKSGHYQPPPLNLLQSVVSLTRQGYSDQYVVRCMYADRSQLNFPSIQEFCVHHKFDDSVIESLDVIVAFETSQRESYSYSQPSYSVYNNYTAYSGSKPKTSMPSTYSYTYQPQYSQYSRYKVTDLPDSTPSPTLPPSTYQHYSVPVPFEMGSYTFYAYTPVTAPSSSSPGTYAAYSPPVPLPTPAPTLVMGDYGQYNSI